MGMLQLPFQKAQSEEDPQIHIKRMESWLAMLYLSVKYWDKQTLDYFVENHFIPMAKMVQQLIIPYLVSKASASEILESAVHALTYFQAMLQEVFIKSGKNELKAHCVFEWNLLESDDFDYNQCLNTDNLDAFCVLVKHMRSGFRGGIRISQLCCFYTRCNIAQ